MKFSLLLTLVVALTSVASCPDDDANCLHCFASVCVRCANAFINQNGQCIVPLTTIPNCISYASNGVCEVCAFGFSVTNGACVAITSPAGCLSLDRNGACQYCGRGQLITINGCNNDNKCSDHNCALCTYRHGREVCGYCVSGYSVYNNLDGSTKCIAQYPSLYNCRVARYDDTTQCAECHYGYAYTNGFCAPANATQNVNLNFDYSSVGRTAVFGVALGVLLGRMF
jgi:hypothetical protein